MRTRGLKKSPVPRKGAKTPTEGSEAETVTSEAGAFISEDVQSPGADVQEDDKDPSDREITLAIDLKSESMDTNNKIITVDASKLSTEATAGANGASVSVYEEGSVKGNDGSAGVSNVAYEGSIADDKTEYTSETRKKAEADGEVDQGDADFEMENEEDEVEDIEVEGLQIDDEVEDEDEDDSNLQVKDEVDADDADVDEDNEADNPKDHVDGHAPGRGIEKFTDQMSLVKHYSKPIYERRKQKRVEVFVGGLDRRVTEEELRAIFGKVGKVKEVRLRPKIESTKFKRHAYVRYATYLEAIKAVQELNDTEVHGHPCWVLLSEQKDILYLGNIGKDWKKEDVMEALRKYEIEKVENVTLIEDPENGNCHQGFGFLEFTSQRSALRAFKRLIKPDVVFGCERSAQVAWVQHADEPDEAIMFQVRKVFVDGLPSIWDIQRAKELFGKYGEIETVSMGRQRSTSKRKTYGFIEYATREEALACIEAVDKSEIVEGDKKIILKARLVRPAMRRKDVEKGMHGDFPAGQEIGGPVGGAAASEAGESKSPSRRKTGRSRARNERKGQKMKTIKTQASYIGDQENKKNTSSLKQRPLQGGKNALLHHQDNKHNRPNVAANPSIPGNGAGHGNVHPRKKRKQHKRTLSRQNPFAAVDAEAYAHNPKRAGVHSFDPDRYHDSVRGYREARGRKRERADLENDVRYADIPHGGHTQLQLTHPETVSLAVPGPQYASPHYARVPYYESSPRFPAGHVAHYAVVQGLTSPPGTIIQRQPPYALYGQRPPVYAAGGYNYTEVNRSGTYISSAYGGLPHSSTGNLQYSVSAANLGSYH